MCKLLLMHNFIKLGSYVPVHDFMDRETRVAATNKKDMELFWGGPMCQQGTRRIIIYNIRGNNAVLTVTVNVFFNKHGRQLRVFSDDLGQFL